MPKIRRIDFGNIQIDDETFGKNDFILFWNGVETTEKSHEPGIDEFHHILLKGPEIVIYGVGFSNLVKISDSIKKEAGEHNIEIMVLPTPEALKKFQELAKAGKKVAARIHTTC